MDEFNLMLLKISTGLRPNDLEKLIFFCDIEESCKANITSGLHLFTRLRHDQRINKDNVAFLKDLLYTIKRRDLVSHVETFEDVEKTSVSDENAKLDETSLREMNPVSMSNQHEKIGLENIESPSALCDKSPFAQILHPKSLDSGGTNTTPCCTVHWPCLTMSCYKIHFCYVILIVLYLLAIIIVSLLWYGNVPVVSERLSKEASVYRSGKFVIVAVILTFPIILTIVFFARKYHKKRRVTARRTSITSGHLGLANYEHAVPMLGNTIINPNCELEIIRDEQTSSAENLPNNLTRREMEPFLPAPQSKS